MPASDVRAELDRLLSQHGARRVALALLAALARPARRPAAPLSEHLRRDIGLPPVQTRVDYTRFL